MSSVVAVFSSRLGIIRRALPLLGVLILAAAPLYGAHILYTFAGPAGGALNTASTNFTVTISQNYTGTITIALSGGGLTGTTKTLTFSNSGAAQTFTITPTAAGQVTLTPTNSGSPVLTNPSGRLYDTPPTVPSVGTATPGDGLALVAFTPVSPSGNGGSAITAYTATCGTSTVSGPPAATMAIVVTGLTNGTAYTCTVTATNAYGTSAPSSAFAAVTPLAGLGPTFATTVFGEPDFVTHSGGTSNVLLTIPTGVALDASGDLYVVDQSNNRVLDFPAGSTTATAVYGQPNFTSNSGGTSSTQLSLPVGVAVDGSGGVYVADTFGNSRVLYYPAGSTTASVVYGQPNFTSNSGGTSAILVEAPTGVAPDASGGLYVADRGNNRVLYFPAGGTTASVVYGQPNFTSNSSGASATALYAPTGVCLDASGGLYVADQGNNRVLYFPAGNTTATVVYGQPSFTSNSGGTSAILLKSPSGVALDANGGLYVADQQNNRVLYFPAGNTTATVVYGQWNLTSSISATSAVTLSIPQGVALDGKGNLYVADQGNNRVMKFPAVAKSYTVTGPAGGALSTASTNFTVTPNGPSTATITITPSGGGLSTPIVLTFTNSATEQTFTITPTAVGPVTLTPTNNGTLTNAAALTYTTPPAAPSISSVTPGNAQVSVAFTANATGGSTITGYAATCGTSTISGSPSPIAVTGLTNGTAYTCTVMATNAYGSSAASTASSSVMPVSPVTSYTLTGPAGGVLNTASANFTVTPNGPYTGMITITPSGGGLSTPIVLIFTNSATAQAITIRPTATGPVTLTPTNSGSLTNPSALAYNTPPAAPTITSVTPGNARISVAFTSNGTGGSAITGYAAICGNSTIGGSASPILVTSLTNGTAYTCTVIATNTNGTSAVSPASSQVTPVAPASSFTLTGPSGGALNAVSGNVTVTPNALYTGTITISPSGGGLSTPIVLAFSNSSAAQVFTITPIAVGPVTLTATNNGSLINSAALIYSTPPVAPTITSVTAANGQVAVAFTGNGTGGSAITGYAATCGTSTIAGPGSPITVTGLTNGTAYTCTVKATNTNGSSAASNVSNSVTPISPVSSYTFSGPSGGLLSAASTNFTVTPNGPYNGTITITPSGYGISTPIILTFSNSSSPRTFTITPTGVGPVTLTATNNSSLTNPAALTYSTPPAAPYITSTIAGDGQIVVVFTANGTGGAAIAIYSASCGGSTIAGVNSPIAVKGLTNGTPYTCTVTATNAIGTSASSTSSTQVSPVAPVSSFTLSGPGGGVLNAASSNFTVTPNGPYTGTVTITASGGGLSTAIPLIFVNSSAAQTFTTTPVAVGPVTLTATNSGSLANPAALMYTTPPAAPTITSATAGNGQVTVAFTANGTGGSAILGYAATCGSRTIIGPGSPIVVTGLTNGTAYTCTVTAANTNGNGAASTGSNSVTPISPVTSYTFSGPSGGLLNAASGNFTVTPNGPYTGIVTITPSGGGLSTPMVLTFNNSSSPRTFTTTPTTVGPLTLTATNNGSLMDPAALTYSTPPAAPSISWLTPGNSQISVAFAAGATGGSVIMGYTVICAPGAIIAAGLASPITVARLTNGTAYTCQVSAVNGIGGGLWSAAEPAVTPVGPPDAPQNVSIVAGNGTAVVSFSAPGNNGGSAITSYVATCTPGVETATGAQSPIMVTGLTNGDIYTCSAAAVNAAGMGTSASSSNFVTPTGLSVANGASYDPGAVTPGFLGAVFGQNMASATISAPPGNLPTALGGTSLTLIDSANKQIPLPLYFVSTGQINFVIPATAQLGNATLMLNANGSRANTPVGVSAVHPGLFSAGQNGTGPAVGTVQYYNADGTSSYDSTIQCGPPAGAPCTATPLAFAAPGQRIFLSFYGTGFRGRSSLSGVQVMAGGVALPILYVGAQSERPGVDQLDVELLRSLAGASTVTVLLTVDGQTANPVTIFVH